MLVDLRPKGITGKDAEAVLGRAHITVQQERHPERSREADGDQRHPPRHAGDDHARLPRGEAESSPHLIADVLDKPARRGGARARARARSTALDAAISRLPLSRPRPCAARSAATRTPRSSRRARSDEASVIRRRRKCLNCDKRFTTYERVEIAMPRLVKKDGSRVEFDRDKLRGSMKLALRKRPVSTEQSTPRSSASRTSCSPRRARGADARRSGELVMRELKHRQGRLRPLRLGVPQLRGRRTSSARWCRK